MSYSYNTSSGGRGYAPNPYSGGYAPNPYSGGYAPYTYANQQNNNWGQRGKASFNLFEGNGNYDESEYDENEYSEYQEEDQGDDQGEDQEEYQEDDQGEEEEDNQEEDQGDDQEEQEEEDDADYDDGINYGTCSSPNCTNMCHPEASDRCPICAPRAYDLPQFRYCEAVLVHEVYPSIDVDPYYGYDRGYKYENNPGAHVDNSKPGDLSLTEDEIFCNHPGCYNKINMRRQSYCSKHR